MKRVKSFALALILLFLLVLLLGRFLKGLDIVKKLSSGLGTTKQQVAAAPTPKLKDSASQPDKTTPPSKPAPSATAVVIPVRHIEGLILHLSQPLLFEVSGVQGLAAGPDFFYIAASDSQSRQATLYRVRRDTCQKDASRSLGIGSLSTLGGIHLGQTLLWVPLSQDTPTPETLILGIDPATLETKHTIAVDHQIGAVAQGPDGLIYGTDAQTGAFYVWNLEGTQLQQVDNSTGVHYTDLEIAGGRVLAVAVTEVQTGGNKEVCGVVDILDPVTFDLVVRRVSHARSLHNNQVTRSGFALASDEFFFLPDEGKMAMLLTYRLAGVDLRQYTSKPTGP